MASEDPSSPVFLLVSTGEGQARAGVSRAQRNWVSESHSTATGSLYLISVLVFEDLSYNLHLPSMFNPKATYKRPANEQGGSIYQTQEQPPHRCSETPGQGPKARQERGSWSGSHPSHQEECQESGSKQEKHHFTPEMLLYILGHIHVSLDVNQNITRDTFNGITQARGAGVQGWGP